MTVIPFSHAYRPTHLDLFSGIGGFALAAAWAGFETIGFCEIDEWCQRVLRTNFPAIPVWGDVRKLGFAEVATAVADAERERGTSGEVQAGHVISARAGGTAGASRTSGARCTVDLITAGYPCQPFSLAGKRLGAADDRHLWPEVARLIGELRPRWFLGENVAGHINMGLDDVLSDLEALGYTGRPLVIPACAVNAPHRRDRVWIMAHAERGGRREQLRTDAAHERIDGRWRAWSRSAEPANGGEVVRDTESDLRGARRDERRIASDRAGGGDWESQAQQRVGVSDDGLSRRLVDPRWGGNPLNAFGPDWEDGVPRVVATERDRVNKLKALGNSIVPQVAYQILREMGAAA